MGPSGNCGHCDETYGFGTQRFSACTCSDAADYQRKTLNALPQWDRTRGRYVGGEDALVIAEGNRERAEAARRAKALDTLEHRAVVLKAYKTAVNWAGTKYWYIPGTRKTLPYSYHPQEWERRRKSDNWHAG